MRQRYGSDDATTNFSLSSAMWILRAVNDSEPARRLKTDFVVSRIILLPVFYFLCQGALAQGILDLKMDTSAAGKPLKQVLAAIEEQHGARFFFRSEWFEGISFAGEHSGKTLAQALDEVLTGTGLDYISMYPDAVVFIKDQRQARLRQRALDDAARAQKKIERYTFGDPAQRHPGPFLVRGIVTNTTPGNPIPGVNLFVSDGKPGAATDASGKFEIYLAAGPHVLEFSALNYENKVYDIQVFADGELNVQLDERGILLREVVVEDQAARSVSGSNIGQVQLQMRDLQRAPSLLGEADLVRQVQQLAGVTVVGEAASGFNVRGGSVDQNLILYDGLPVFNSAHVFGFFSAFNPEAVRDVSFYKGGIPAFYGGRTSSVLDIQSRDGDFKEWNGRAGIGVITGNVMANGPLKKDKTSLAVSARSTYSNWLTQFIHTDYVDLRKSAVTFYDGTVKLAHLFTGKTKLSVTGYASKDAFSLMGDSTYQWQNFLASARLDHEFSPDLRAEFVTGVSIYGYSVKSHDPLTASKLSYRITSSVANAAFAYHRDSHKLGFGIHAVHYTFQPGEQRPLSAESNARNLSMPRQYALENALYVSDEWSFLDRVFVEGGVRVPVFVAFGPGSINLYAPGAPKEALYVVDTLQVGRGNVIKAFVGLEPRLSLRWMAGTNASVKFGYNRMYQYLHLVTNTAAVTPLDIWQPSGYYFRPQRADQVSAGYFRDMANKKYSLSGEVFYKAMDDIVDFKDGAELILNPHLETDLLQGRGRSYGAEASLSKNSGRLITSLNYTYSRSFRLIDGPSTTESINRGREYPSNFDQPHIVNFSWKYNLSRRYFFTGSFTYHSGRPVTIPLSAFQWENNTVAYFSGRNQYRIPDYHRLDLALVVEPNHRRKKFGGTWVFSVYNVYARRNPYTIFFRSEEAGLPKPYQLSIIGTAFPSISYNVRF